MLVQTEINKIMEIHSHGKCIVYDIPTDVHKYELFTGLILQTNSRIF